MEEKQTPLGDIMSWREWYSRPGADRLFPSLESLRWFINQNKVELIERGAMVRLRGQWHFVEPNAKQAMLALFREKAMEQVAA